MFRQFCKNAHVAIEWRIRYAKSLVWMDRIRQRLEQARCWFSKRPRVVLVRHGALGDVICTFPAIQALRTKYPKSEIIFYVGAAHLEIVKLSGVADRVIPVCDIERPFAPPLRAADRLFTMVYGDELDEGGPPAHLVDEFCKLAGVTPQSRQPRIVLPTSALSMAANQTRLVRRGTGPVIAAHPGPSWDVRLWTPAAWDQLCASLRRELDATMIQLGTEAAGSATPRIQGAVDWVNRHTIVETAAVLQSCDALIAIDSGLVHLAGAVGTPVVGLFGFTDPLLRLPPVTPSLPVRVHLPCSGCHHRRPRLHWKTGCPYDVECMRRISPGDVLSAVRQLLGTPNGSRSVEMLQLLTGASHGATHRTIA